MRLAFLSFKKFKIKEMQYGVVASNSWTIVMRHVPQHYNNSSNTEIIMITIVIITIIIIIIIIIIRRRRRRRIGALGVVSKRLDAWLEKL